MKNASQGKLLASVLDDSRKLTLFYLKHAENLDKEKRFEIDGFRTCNIHWIIAHLSWAEDYLILRGLGNTNGCYDWLDRFGIGQDFPDNTSFPEFQYTLDCFNEVHKKSLCKLQEIADYTLDEPNSMGLRFGADNTKRKLVHHAIRHESVHCGHLGWLIRMLGSRVI